MGSAIFIPTSVSMIAEEIEQGPGRDILEAVGKLGGSVDTAEEITRLRAPWSRQACFRLQLTDGRIVKARRFESAKKRESVAALYPSLEGLPFSRVLSTHGAATIEEWIHGSPVTPGDLSPERIHELASLLGTLHSRCIPPEISTGRTRDFAGYSSRLSKHLSLLAEQGHVGTQFSRELFGLAVSRGAVELERGIIHTDFHPRNMVTSEDGVVWIIDNEDIRLGALDYDIARCWRQWPMTREQRDVFCKAYSRFRSLESFLAHQEFWSICTLVNTAKIRMRYQKPLQPFLTQLEQISQGSESALWPERSSDDDSKYTG